MISLFDMTRLLILIWNIIITQQKLFFIAHSIKTLHVPTPLSVLNVSQQFYSGLFRNCQRESARFQKDSQAYTQTSITNTIIKLAPFSFNDNYTVCYILLRTHRYPYPARGSTSRSIWCQGPSQIIQLKMGTPEYALSLFFFCCLGNDHWLGVLGCDALSEVVLAEKHPFGLGIIVQIEGHVAFRALETKFVPNLASSLLALLGVDRFFALGALLSNWGLERHDDLVL